MCNLPSSGIYQYKEERNLNIKARTRNTREAIHVVIEALVGGIGERGLLGRRSSINVAVDGLGSCIEKRLELGDEREEVDRINLRESSGRS
jgi:hypothetical protein